MKGGGAMSAAYGVGMNKRPLQPQPQPQPQPGAGVCLAYTQDGTAVYKHTPGAASQASGPVGGNDTNPAAAAAPAEQHKRKRGRPRKYDTMALAVVPASPPAAASAAAVAAAPGAGAPSLAAPTLPPGFSSGLSGGGMVSQSAPPPALPATEGVLAHNKRGRPPQNVAEGSGGVALKPHVIIVQTGEDVVSKVMSFSQNGSAVCVLSANGDVSNVTLRQATSSGATVNYEGRFEILSLSGSYLLLESDGLSSRIGGLSVSLAGPDGRVLGGGVAGPLNAASPVQVVIGSFDGKKEPKQVVPGGTPIPGVTTPPSRGTTSGSSGGPSSPPNHSAGGSFNTSGQLTLADYPWR